MRGACINDLPAEVLVRIFDDPEVASSLLLSVASTSRRLHYTCIPLYLARFGIDDPLESCEIVLRSSADEKNPEDALSGLRIALFVKSMKSLVCRFDDDLQDYRLVIRNLDRLHDFLSHLTSVHQVTLDFGISKRCGCCSESDLGEVIDDSLQVWSQAMGRVLNSILAKSCTSLSVAGGRYMGHSYSFKSGSKTLESANKGQGTLSTLKTLFGKGTSSRTRLQDDKGSYSVLRGNNWQFNRTPRTGKAIVLTPLSLPDAPLLHSLDIQSMMFTVPPLLHWFIGVLQLETVQTLSLKNLSVHRKCWPAILSLIATSAPHLQDIHFSSLRQIDPIDLLEFVSAFPSLTNLHIAHDVDSFDSFDLPPFPDFPCLVSLHAPAAWVFRLLSSQKKGLAHLESLSIVYNIKNDGLSHWIERPFVPSIPILLKDQQRPLTISLTVHLGSTPGWTMLEHIKKQDVVKKSEADAIGSLTLILDQQVKRSDMPLAQVLVKWSALFPYVHHISLEVRSKAQGSVDPESLAKQILREGILPLLSSLEVNGTEWYGTLESEGDS